MLHNDRNDGMSRKQHARYEVRVLSVQAFQLQTSAGAYDSAWRWQEDSVQAPIRISLRRPTVQLRDHALACLAPKGDTSSREKDDDIDVPVQSFCRNSEH